MLLLRPGGSGALGGTPRRWLLAVMSAELNLMAYAAISQRASNDPSAQHGRAANVLPCGAAAEVSEMRREMARVQHQITAISASWLTYILAARQYQ